MTTTHKENITKFVEGLLNNDDVQTLYRTYENDLQVIKPQEIFELLSTRLASGEKPEHIIPYVDKLVNVFYVSLTAYAWERPGEGHFIYYLMKENDALIGILEAFKNVAKSGDLMAERPAIKMLLKQCGAYNSHLQKLENILFPYMEKSSPHFKGLTIMWTLHDETRKVIKEMTENLNNEETDEQRLRVQLGQLYFKLYGLVQKQTLLLFPSAVSILKDRDFKAMHIQSFDYDFPYISPPKKPDDSLVDFLYEEGDIAEEVIKDDHLIKTETGVLNVSQMVEILNHLPVDITFIDSEDKVAFFTKPKDRLFPRSPAVIGRDVRNCHPSQSIEKVEAILSDFKSGGKDMEQFWIELKESVLFIQYFAVRDSEGTYMGTLEVVQDVTQIQKLKGEKRLLS